MTTNEKTPEETEPESVPEVGAYYDTDVDGEYTPNGGAK